MYAPCSGVSLHIYSPNRFIKAVAPAYPILILLVIMATANHYLVDAVGGGLVSVLAYKLNRVLLNLRPVEEWGFWLTGVEKPMEKELFTRLLAESRVDKWEEEQHLLTSPSGPASPA